MFDRLAHLNRVDRSKVHDFIAPRDAVSFLLVDRSAATYKLLMGRRSSKQDFMPNVFVFPGGAVEISDHEWAGCYDRALWPFFSKLSPQASAYVSSASPSLTGALLRCGVRETFEETGLDLFYHELFHNEVFDEGQLARFFSHIVLLSRAITPPGRKRRFDTRFFVLDVEGLDLSLLRDSSELHDLHFVSYEEALKLPLHAMTRVILEDANDFLLQQKATDDCSFFSAPPKEIAFYQYVSECFSQRWLEMQSSS